MHVPDWPPDLPALAAASPMPGGLVCTVLGGRLVDGRSVVVKRCPYPAAVEADGLTALASAGAPVPAVLGVRGAVLVLERVGGNGPASDGPAADGTASDGPTSDGTASDGTASDGTGSDGTGPDWAGLGRAVARLHRTTGPRFGWHRDNSGGRITQHNGWCDDWPGFFVERRVRVHLRDPAVPGPLRRRLERACAGPLPALLPDRPPASLTHGDLWVGNVVDGRWLVDPAVSYADRELELAFLDMSDGLPAEFHAGYRAEWPPDPGYPNRRPALQLHKLLVNLRHFGDRYVPRIEAVLDGYGW
jgi:Fructosamine kinase